MNSCHQTIFNTKCVVQNFGDWCQAVCGARCVRNKLSAFNIRIGVYAANKHRSVIFRRCRHNNIFSTGVNVTLRFFFCQEQTCRFYNVISVDVAPFQISRVLFCSNADSFAVYNQFTVFNFNSTVETTVHCVIFQHISHIFNIDQIVNANDFNIISCLSSAENQTANTTESINTNANNHIIILLSQIVVRTAPHGHIVSKTGLNLALKMKFSSKIFI